MNTLRNLFSMPSLFSLRFAGFPLLLSGFLFTSCGSSETAEFADDESAVPNKPAGMAVAVLDVQPEPFSHRFSIQGNVETDMNSILTAEFAGLIEEVLVSEGVLAHNTPEGSSLSVAFEGARRTAQYDIG